MDEETRRKRLGRKLKEHRKRYGNIKQRALEDKFGLGSSIISKVETGQQFPTSEHLREHINFFKDDLLPSEIEFLWQLHTGEVETMKIPLQRPSRAENFVGRENELDWLKDNLQRGRTVTLVGPGGIGKSALAAEAVWDLAPGKDPPEEFPGGIIYYNFYNQTQVSLAYEHIARSLGEEIDGSTRDAARRALDGKQVLVVLDGAEAADDLPGLRDVVDQYNGGVLVTSRFQKDAVVPKHRKEINPLPIDKSINLLQRWGGKYAGDKKTVKRICELIGGLPLAVRLIGQYLDSTGDDSAEFLTWLEESPFEALDQGQRKLDNVEVLLEKSISQVSDVARQILTVAGALAMNPFSREVVSTALEISEQKLHKPLAELRNYGLLKRNNQRYVVTHALIYTYTQKRMQVEPHVWDKVVAYYIQSVKEQRFERLFVKEDLDYYRGNYLEGKNLMQVLAGCEQRGEWQAIHDLLGAMKDNPNFEDLATIRVPTLTFGAKAANKLGYRKNEADYLARLGLLYSFRDETMEKSIDHCQQALLIYRRIGDQQSEEATTHNRLGGVYHELGEMEKAIDHHQQALLIYRRIGDQYEESYSHERLGVVYRELGEMEKAIDHHQQALLIYRRIGDQYAESRTASYTPLVFTPSDRESFVHRHLGITYYELGRYREAIENFLLAIETTPAQPSNTYYTIYYNLADVCLKLGQIDQARELYHKRVSLRPIDALYAYVCLGAIEQQQGNKIKAQTHFKSAKTAYYHDILLPSQFHLLGLRALAFLGLGQADQAITTLKEALSRRSQGKR